MNIFNQLKIPYFRSPFLTSIEVMHKQTEKLKNKTFHVFYFYYERMHLHF